MNCEEANQIDMVDYLNALGYQAKKIRGNNYWYSSPFRNEKEPSFKVDRNRNVWYDHGAGKGGKVIDFTMEFYKCNVIEALQKIATNKHQSPFQGNFKRPPFHLHEKPTLSSSDAAETIIKIIAAKQPIQDLMLCRYLKQRRIAKNIADKYCYEVQFTNGNKDKLYKAIGFKNNAGGFELRNEYFKGSSSPKEITFLNNKKNNVTVFEGFFDFLSYQSIYQNTGAELPEHPSNFLILNSLSFFEKSFDLMEKHNNIHLYLDQDNSGKKWVALAQKRSSSYTDESKLYKDYKDLNDWMVNFGKVEKQRNSTCLRRHL
jgi:hypothetical protein